MKILSSLVLGLLLSTTASATTVGDKAAKIQDLLGEYARNDSYSVKRGTALEMVKGYIAAKYVDDKEMGEQYEYVENGTFKSDEQIAGTITYETATKVTYPQHWSRKQIGYFRSLLKEIDEAGGSFGFDGFEQHGCAAPTTFLLIIDAEGETVYGVDMEPCSES